MKSGSALTIGLNLEYVPLPSDVLPLDSGSLSPVTGWRPALSALSCCLSPPVPTALCLMEAGGGPGQQSFIRCDVRLSAKQPHVSHHTTVPAVISRCLLPLPASPCSPPAAMRVRALALESLHLEVASLAQDVDLPLHLEQSQQWPERASSMECPPLLAGTMGFARLGPLFLLPSTPAFPSALFL